MLCGINFQAYIKNFVPKKVYTIENIIAIRGRVPLLSRGLVRASRP